MSLLFAEQDTGPLVLNFGARCFWDGSTWVEKWNAMQDCFCEPWKGICNLAKVSCWAGGSPHSP
jgi:hypothetical protein